MWLKYFKNLELHDQLLDLFSIDLASKRLLMRMSINNEEKGDYDNLEISFLNIESIELSNTIISNFSSVEIYSHTISEERNIFLIQFNFLTNSEIPTWDLSFKFTDCSLILNGKDYIPKV